VATHGATDESSCPDTGGMRFPDATRFGAPSRPIEAATALLRARAAASGLALRPAPPVDLLAAAVTADAWAAVLGASSLDEVRAHGAAATAVLAAALARAAGYPGSVVEVPLEDCASSPEFLRLAEQHRCWVGELCPDAPGQVLMRAWPDLYAAGAGTRLAAYGALLQLLATEPW